MSKQPVIETGLLVRAGFIDPEKALL